VGVVPRSPKGRAAARGLDAHLRLQHAFMPVGDASLKTAQLIKMLVDSNHGIYRDLLHRHVRAMNVGAVKAPNDSEELGHAEDHDNRSRHREVGFPGSWHRYANAAGSTRTRMIRTGSCAFQTGSSGYQNFMFSLVTVLKS
jgi:hypothetical protein